MRNTNRGGEVGFIYITGVGRARRNDDYCSTVSSIKKGYNTAVRGVGNFVYVVGKPNTAR